MTILNFVCVTIILLAVLTIQVSNMNTNKDSIVSICTSFIALCMLVLLLTN